MLLILIILVSTILPKNTSAAVTIGDTYHYKVVSSRISALAGSNSVKSRGIYFYGDNYPVGSIVDVYVTSIGDGFVANLSIGDNSRLYSYSMEYIKHILFDLLTMASYYTYALILSWNNAYFEEGFYLKLYPYIKPTEEYWSFLNDTGDLLVTELKEYEDLGHSIKYDYLFEDSNNKIYFETWNKGQVNGEIDAVLGYPFGLPANCYFENRFQIVFEKSTGLLLGMHLKGETKGEIDQGAVKINLNFKIEKTNYNLPLFKLANKTSLTIYIFIPICSVAIGCGSYFIIRKIVRKRTTKETNAS